MKQEKKEKIIRKNPLVNPVQLKEVLIVIEDLRAQGINKKTYNILPPFAHKPKLHIDKDSPSSFY